jgi:hypothetical protein
MHEQLLLVLFEASILLSVIDGGSNWSTNKKTTEQRAASCLLLELVYSNVMTRRKISLSFQQFADMITNDEPTILFAMNE